MIGKLSFLIIFLFSVNSIFATTFKAAKDGKWEARDTWNHACNCVPSLATDSIHIDGYDVTIDNATMTFLGVDSISIAYLKFTNLLNVGPTQFFLTEEAKLVVTGDIDGTSDNVWRNMLIKLFGNSFLHVNGNVNLQRTSNNIQWTYLQLAIANNAQLTVDGDFEYDYKNSGIIGIYDEIFMTDQAILTVYGDSKLISRAGNALDFYMAMSAKS